MTLLGTLSFIILVVLAGFYVYTYKLDRSILSAFPARGKFTSVPGGTIHWTVQGNGPAVVLVHGLAGNMHNFAALEKQLSERFRVYCLDRPGSGHSKRTYGTDPSFTSQAKMISAWMDAENLPSAIFVGHSMGGAISLNLAIHAPDKVDGLALICPLTAPLTIKPSRLTKVYLKSPALRLAVAKGFSPVIHSQIGRKQVNAIFKPETPSADFANRYGGALSMLSKAFNAASGDLSNAQQSLHEQIKRYPEIKCPVTVLFGQEDRILPCKVHTEMIKATIPHANITVMEKRGHMLPITAVEACADVIKTLATKLKISSN